MSNPTCCWCLTPTTGRTFYADRWHECCPRCAKMHDVMDGRRITHGDDPASIFATAETDHANSPTLNIR